MHSKIVYIAVLLLAVVLCSGCSTVQLYNDSSVTPGPYVGTKHAFVKTKRYWNNYDYYGQVTLAAADVPLCLILDTVLLPYAIYQKSNI